MLMLLRIGTWQDSDGGKAEDPTNVTRLARSIEPVGYDGTPQVLLFYLQMHVNWLLTFVSLQIVYYQSGVGTSFGWFSSFTGGEWVST